MRRALSHLGGPVSSRGDRDVAKVLSRAMAAAAAAPHDVLTHGFHSYPGRMHYAIARELIARLAAPGALVLDPFCGSGTVLLEAMIAGRGSAGVDRSPLGLRVAEVKCQRRSGTSRAIFVRTLERVGARSLARVRCRERAVAPLTSREAARYDPHVLRELAGLREEILCVADERDRRALEVVLSALVVKLSKQRADTDERDAAKRIRKGLATDLLVRKGRELAERWEAVSKASPAGGWPEAPRLVEGDARRLPEVLGAGFTCDLVVTSPPYGGTYDYWQHHARRYPWLGLDASALERDEIGARRKLGGRQESVRQWDKDVAAYLGAMASVMVPGSLAALLVGDARVGGARIDAAEQTARLCVHAGLEAVATASAPRPDWLDGRAQREHLVALRRRRAFY